MVTAAGIIGFGAQLKLHFLPSDRYKVLPSDCVVIPKLRAIRKELLDGTFVAGKYPHVTLQQAHTSVHGVSPGGKVKCACKRGICKKCKCAKAGEPCTSACRCNGSCGNPSNSCD